MPDWSYRTVLRPLMLAMQPERARRVAVGTLARLSRLPFGPAVIDFLGHMKPDPRLALRRRGIELGGPVALGSMIDPAGEASAAFSRFGAGLIEIGPVREHAVSGAIDWRVDLEGRRVTAAAERAVGVDEVVANLERAAPRPPLCVRIGERDPAAIRRLVARLRDHAALFSLDAGELSDRDLRAAIAAAAGARPVMVRASAQHERLADVAHDAIDAGAAGVWLVSDDADKSAGAAARLRGSFPEALLVAGGVTEPEDARRLLAAGADCVAVDAGLIVSGPGLIKRINEALLSLTAEESPLETLSLDAARSAWFWAFLLGVGMFAGGVLALIIASTRVVLPYDEALCGLTRSEMATLNPRLLPFMAHDRVSLAGTMMSIGIFYAALAWFAIRRGEHWAHVTVVASSVLGFFTFFLFLGFGYFDPFHAFVTAILTQFTLLCLVMKPSPRQPPHAEWRETAAWRRAQWGQMLFVILGAGLFAGGVVIAAIGSTYVFVQTDLEFMRTTAAQLALSFERLVPLVAHDRASLGGMLIANGIVVLLTALWGLRAGARWLWTALAWGGTLAFASAVVVHLVVGYIDALHLAPAFAGWLLWSAALLLTRDWMTGRTPRQVASERDAATV